MDGNCKCSNSRNTALTFCCREGNDLYGALVKSGSRFQRYDTLEEALANAAHGSGVLALADDYPAAGVAVSEAALAAAASKSLKLYVEYPSAIPGLALGEPTPTKWERVVISSGFFSPQLESGTILALHGCWYLPVKASAPHMVAARVAGYHKAVFGLPAKSSPILFELPGSSTLVAASKLSQFITGRYGPAPAWKALWQQILNWLTNGSCCPDISWSPEVSASYGNADELPADCEKTALERVCRWFHDHVIYSIDWKKGATEGFESIIDHRGKQLSRPWARGDCVSETAMAVAYEWAVGKNPASKHIARQMMNYVWSTPDFRQADPQSPLYGLSNWFERGLIFYGDDNARVILASMASAALLDDSSWDEHILRCIFANLRTAGKKGFRRNALTYPASFSGKSWKDYYNEDFVVYAPHYQAYLWTCYLWAYSLTGYDEFLEKARAAIHMTMKAYPSDWKWQNGFSNEIARMLLPLSFLIRIEDTDEHRQWLYRLTDDLLQLMQPCGAIREKLGPLANGKYPPPQSNEEYGTKEASLLQEDGDPACDLLYTANWALLGLHEAHAATGDTKFKEAEDRLMEFLCRIQVRSESHPYLNGCWMRSFDYELWEYWGSSADLGWGAWCVETGWTNSWIASVLAMRQLNKSLFDLTLTERFKAIAPEIAKEMLEEKLPKAPDMAESYETGALPGSDQDN